MTQAERRHDRLAVRLSLIISRLVAGETLSVRKLAAEFGVSVRTLRRDFRERLMYLDLEYQSGYCRLRTAGSETQMVPDVLIFAHRSGMAGLFPGFDRRLVNALLMCDESPCNRTRQSGSFAIRRIVFLATDSGHYRAQAGDADCRGAAL
jgi:predicted DNA-binding transcriptional regulator YafY